MVENNKTNHEIIDIEKIDADLLNKYEFRFSECVFLLQILDCAL